MIPNDNYLMTKIDKRYDSFSANPFLNKFYFHNNKENNIDIFNLLIEKDKFVLKPQGKISFDQNLDISGFFYYSEKLFLRGKKNLYLYDFVQKKLLSIPLKTIPNSIKYIDKFSNSFQNKLMVGSDAGVHIFNKQNAVESHLFKDMKIENIYVPKTSLLLNDTFLLFTNNKVLFCDIEENVLFSLNAIAAKKTFCFYKSQSDVSAYKEFIICNFLNESEGLKSITLKVKDNNTFETISEKSISIKDTKVTYYDVLKIPQDKNYIFFTDQGNFVVNEKSEIISKIDDDSKHSHPNYIFYLSLKASEKLNKVFNSPLYCFLNENSTSIYYSKTYLDEYIKLGISDEHTGKYDHKIITDLLSA